MGNGPWTKFRPPATILIPWLLFLALVAAVVKFIGQPLWHHTRVYCLAVELKSKALPGCPGRALGREENLVS